MIDSYTYAVDGCLVTITDPVTLTMSRSDALSIYHALTGYLNDLDWRIGQAPSDKVREYMIANYHEVERLTDYVNGRI